MIAHTPLMPSDFHCFAECCRHTTDLPPPCPPPPSLYSVLLCGGGEVWTRQSGKHSGKENPKQWERVVGCGLPSAPGGVWGKWLRTKLQRWEHRQGQSAPGHSPVVQHKNTPPSAQVQWFKKKPSQISQISNRLIQYDIGLHVFVAIFLMCQGFWRVFPQYWNNILVLGNSSWHNLTIRSVTLLNLLIIPKEVSGWCLHSYHRIEDIQISSFKGQESPEQKEYAVRFLSLFIS